MAAGLRESAMSTRGMRVSIGRALADIAARD
jgi:hypothetical protein